MDRNEDVARRGEVIRLEVTPEEFDFVRAAVLHFGEVVNNEQAQRIATQHTGTAMPFADTLKFVAKISTQFQRQYYSQRIAEETLGEFSEAVRTDTVQNRRSQSHPQPEIDGL